MEITGSDEEIVEQVATTINKLTEDSNETKLDVWVKKVEHNTIFSGKMIAHFGRSLQFSNLTKISVKGKEGGFKLNDEHLIVLTESILKVNIQLVDLLLTYHDITDVGVQELGRLLKNSEGNYNEGATASMEGLDLEGNDITGSCFNALKLTSSSECSLVYFNISCNPLSEEGREILGEVSLRNKTLRQLYMSTCGGDMKSTVLLLTNLTCNSTLQLLHIDRSLADSQTKCDEITDHASRFLRTSTAMYDMSMRYFGIMDLGAKLLSEALVMNDYLVVLNLECNHIGIRGAEALASYLILRKEKSLKTLCLSNNSIGNDGAIAFAEAISENRCLKHLTLKNNNIKAVGLNVLAEGLGSNQNGEPGLRYISLLGNEFTNANGSKFAELFSTLSKAENLYPVAKERGIIIETKWKGEAYLRTDFVVYVADGNYMIAESNAYM